MRLRSQRAGLFLAVGLPVILACCASAWAVQATLIADTHVNSARPTANSGSISNLNVGNGYTTLAQFDVSTLPSGTTAAQVTRAVLLLYCNRVNTAGTVTVQPVNASWGEYSVTYATLPAFGGTVATFNVSQAAAYVALDITPLVQGWISMPSGNNGLALTSAGADLQFDSKENDQTGHAPSLDITLATSGPAGPVGSTGPMGQPGPQGATGPSGPSGAPGASGPAGPVGLQFKGPYSPATAYGVGDGVLYGGAGYVSLVAGNRGNLPNTSPAQWSEFASGGAGPAGLQGPAGPIGPQGVPGPPGLTGAQGPMGPSGATGSVGPVGPAGPMGATGVTGAQGAVGPLGPAGPIGPAGPQGPIGIPGVRYRGGWSAYVSYQANDAVSYAGSTYLAQAANSAQQPNLYATTWAVLAAAGAVGSMGPTGPSGPGGPAATVSIGNVTTGAAGSPASVTNTGTTSSAVFNFTIPQGQPGAGGAAGATGTDVSAASVYHAVSNSNLFYSVTSGNFSGGSDAAQVLTWLPNGCTATKLQVYSQQGQTITVALRQGLLGAMTDTQLVCVITPNSSCQSTGSIPVPAGSFIDFHVLGANVTPSPVWTALECH